MLRPRNSMDLLSSASLSESVTSTRAVFRRLKRALFGGAFLFPTESRSPCCSTRSIPIGGITKEKQLHFLELTERLFGLKKQTSPSPTKCRPRTNEGAEPKACCLAAHHHVLKPQLLLKGGENQEPESSRANRLQTWNIGERLVSEVHKNVA